MYTFRPGLRYLMPTHFGPSTGPRQGPDGEPFDYGDQETLSISTTCPAPAAELEPFLPQRFSLLDDTISVAFSYLDRVPWLAGRGYNILSASVPVRFAGAGDAVDGDLMLVLWENLTEPIITGREELGIAKIHCQLPPPRTLAGTTTCRASWDGCEFARLTYTPDPAAAGDAPVRATGTVGARPWLHLAYLPSTARPGTAEVEQVTMTPPARDGVARLLDSSAGSAQLSIAEVSWEQLPTQFMIVNALHGLGLTGGPARLVRSRGAEDVSRQTVLD